jgi:hypothetical protein
MNSKVGTPINHENLPQLLEEMQQKLLEKHVYAIWTTSDSDSYLGPSAHTNGILTAIRASDESGMIYFHIAPDREGLHESLSIELSPNDGYPSTIEQIGNLTSNNTFPDERGHHQTLHICLI